jgi:hypothetical protein
VRLELEADGVPAGVHTQLVLSRKLFANVNSLFANGSEIVILGRHVACQRDTGKGAWPSRSGSFQGWTIRWRERPVHRGRLRWYGRIRYRGSDRQL